jgi:hypothetical protein
MMTEVLHFCKNTRYIIFEYLIKTSFPVLKNEYHGELCIKHLLTSAIKMTIIAEKKRHATDITQNNR